MAHWPGHWLVFSGKLVRRGRGAMLGRTVSRAWWWTYGSSSNDEGHGLDLLADRHMAALPVTDYILHGWCRGGKFCSFAIRMKRRVI